MTLTLPSAPLASHGPDTVNYRIDGPRHLLLLDPFPRRIRAVFGDETVLDSTRAMLLHESNLLPQLYVPTEDLRADLTTATDTVTHCPFKGDAAYWTVRAGGQVAEDAVWGYPQPIESASWLVDYRAVYWDAMDTWLDEDEEVIGHLRDPYTRVDVVPTSREVTVSAGGTVLVRSRSALILSETSLPNRYYIPRADVPDGLLEDSATHTVCPYKGIASYHSVRTPVGVLPDAAWFYPEPYDAVRRIAEHVCFLADGLEITVH